MDLREILLTLVAPAGVGDELAPGVRLTGASTELGFRLTVLVDALHEVHVEVSPRAPGGPHAARTRRLAFTYRSGGAERVDARAGMRACTAVAAAAAPREDAVLAALADEQGDGDGARIREVTVTHLLELAGTPARRFYTLSPYVGCLIGCRFCYAQSRLDPLRGLLGLAPVPWGSYVDVRRNAAEILEIELRERERLPIKFCPIVSDPYQAIERRQGLTRRCLEVLAAADDPPPVMVMTRSDLILRDLELLRAIPQAWVGASIPTLDDEVRAHFEPRAASIPARLAMLRAFKAAGVRRGVVVQPMLPGPIDALADVLAEVAPSVSLGVLRGQHGAAADFADPRYAEATADDWQREHALALRDALVARGVTVWLGELPPEIEAWRPAAPA